jgi:hypothetical protein
MRTAFARPELEAFLVDATQRILGLPAGKVFINDFAPDTAAPERPFVSLTIAPDSTMSRAGTVSYQLGLEYWRFSVASDDDGDYTIEVDGVPVTYAAVDKTSTEIRDELVALLGGPNYTAVAAGLTSIDVESESLGLRLMASASSNIAVTKLRGNVIKSTTRPAELMVQARCVGFYSTTPSATNSGVDMAEKLLVGLYDVGVTAAMREAGFAINNGVVTDISVVNDGFQELVGSMDAICVTNSLFVTTVDSATRATVEVSYAP